MMGLQRWVLLVCVVLSLVSAIGVVYSKFMSRKYFDELQQLLYQRDEVDVEWGRLQLEQGALATHSLVEQKARKKLGMKIPSPDDVRMIRP